MTQVNTENRSDPPVVPAGASEEEYKVGPGRPPKEHQFKPGQSGNPKGAKRKAPSIAPDLKQLLERALNKKVTLKQGENERIVTMFNAGVEQLVERLLGLPEPLVRLGSFYCYRFSRRGRDDRYGAESKRENDRANVQRY